MTVDELIAHLAKGERWFNNGKQRNRKVTDWDTMYIYYLQKSKKTTTGVLITDFAKWAEGSGVKK